MAFMTERLTIDKAGRIVLPKPLRDELRLAAGDTLELETAGERITLRPLRGDAQLRKKHGVWVYRAGEPLTQVTVEKTAQQIREEREARNLGKRA
jgi:AbrB family looped-hinge helix DNA binding protein